MATKLQLITELSERTTQKLTDTHVNWTAFLRTAAWNYKYSFAEQIQIHAQRPDATACASIELWNEKLRRWVNRGAKGIALIDDSREKLVLRYVFDISDTSNRYGEAVYLWTMSDRYEESVTEALENAFGELENKATFADALISSVKNLVDDNLADYLTELMRVRTDSFLEELDDLNVEVELKRALRTSGAYMLMSRCGIDASYYLDLEDFAPIRDFNTLPTISLLGNANSDISEIALREIGSTVRSLHIEKRRAEKFALSQNIAQNRNRTNHEERGAEHGNDIHDAGRFSATRPDTFRSVKNREIWDAAKIFSERAPESYVHEPATVRDAGGALVGDRRDGAGARDANDHTKGQDGRRERDAESSRSDEMDRDDEQSETLGGGNDSGGANLRLTTEQSDKPEIDEPSGLQISLPSVAEQISFIDKAEAQTSALSISQQVIDEVLSSGGNEKRSTLRICAKYMRDKDTDDNIAFLQREYKRGGKGFIIDGQRVSAWWNSKEGILIAMGDTALGGGEMVCIRWNQIERRIRELLELGRYMPQSDILAAPEYERQELASRIWNACRDDFSGIPDEWCEEKGGFPADVKKIASLLSDPVTISGIIMQLETDVEAYDVQSPQRRGYHDVHQLLSDVQDLQREPRAFTAQAAFASERVHFITKDEIDAELCRGGQVESGKYRIYHYFKENSNPKERADFLKQEYGTGGRGDGVFDTWNDAKGLSIRKYSVTEPDGKLLLTWAKAAKRIDELIRADRYLTPDELKKLEAAATVEQITEPEKEKTDEDIKLQAESPIAEIEGQDVSYALPLGTTVWLGQDAYEVLSLSENNVTLYDPSFPLFNKELPRDVFENRLHENPLNDHLIIREEQPQGSTLAEILRDAETTVEGDTVTIDKPGTNKNTKHNIELDVMLPDDAPAVNTVVHQNYRVFAELAPQIISGESSYLRFKAVEGFMPLSIDQLGDDRVAISHTYTQNGDLMADPDMEFVIDREAKTLTARSFQQDSTGTYQSVFDGNDMDEADKELEKSLNRFAKTWFRNIKSQGYRLQCETAYDRVSNENVEITYAADGSVVTVEGNQEAVDRVLAEHGLQVSQPEGLKPLWEAHPTVSVKAPNVNGNRINFHITDDELGYGGPKAKYNFNVAAICALQQIEVDSRLATVEEQEILSRYVGWGGIPDAFDENKPEWGREYAELKQLLSDDEYRSARESTLNAHYTSPVVIKAIYSAIESMGFRAGNILEPSCGVGNFLGLVPESMGNSRLYGVELDSITGRIARQLYQRADIRVQGFETANLPDSFFDVAVGNVPFGQYSVSDKRYDKLKLSIHDYFFIKTLDKVRPGGVVAFITSSYTMDKKSSTVRKYIAERAELLGAVRLPNNAFLKNAGTSVVSDILFLQKRDRPIETEPDWIHLGQTEDGFAINQYFINNPDMVLGQLTEERTQFGHMACTCAPIPGAELSEQLRDAMNNIHAEIIEYDVEDLAENEDGSIPADPEVRNFSFTVVDGKIYYRENSRMNHVETSATGENRIKGMVEIRESVRQLIEYQTEDYSNEDIRWEQGRLNELYDRFTARYDLLNSRANSTVFSDDSSYPLLCSLEVLDDEGNLKRKADMFSKRTIRQHTDVTHVDTATESLAVSIGERACVDLGFMASIMGKPGDIGSIIDDLRDIVYKDPETGDDPYAGWQTADEYLSGNVRTKLSAARKAAEDNPAYAVNVEALEAVQPVDLTAVEISVRLGATWLPPDVVEQFVHELLSPAFYIRRSIKVHYMPYTSEWSIEGKNQDRMNVKANATYGTDRASAYKIIEETLNLRDIRVFDAVYDADGSRKYVINKKETTIARQKQELIKREFIDWIWKDPDRRERLCRFYNDKFNSIRPREYDGRHIQFIGMNPEMALRPHQINAVARVLYGGNTLLAHVVGAGKTYEMVAAAMESKRLGLCQKSMIVVPNHLTDQWAAEFLQLYPAANVLVATRKDFETKNRKKFCGRIATGDYDAVIIGHSQFEKIPLSVERQKAIFQDQIDSILASISDAKANRSENFTIKQLEKSRKSLELKLTKLNDQSRKDDVVTFEEMGVDRLFIDESHFFKNLFLSSKMRNVGGIAQTEAQKSSDLFAKCRYLDELTGARGIIFATGTPISNSMVELYTVQRYLQYDALRREQLQNFDAWASNYGETVTAIELSPEGTGYRSKTRFAKFYNLPELMSMFKEVADIQTADMLDLPVPKAVYHNIALKPSELQREMVADLSERADRVRNKEVLPDEDNMLMITNDGRKLALDQRLMNPMLPDHENSKAAACAENVFALWQEHADNRAAQLVFCDLSTPKGDGSFNVYDDIHNKLIARGIPAEEIAYIHDANTETRKKELFGKVRSGQVRVLMGSTFKMGAGTNVQDRLIAIHNLDCPWRPSDLEQRAGRIIRQGNQNPEVHIFRYVTEATFDAYLYQIIENKQRFISQIMTSKAPVRSAEDIDEAALSYAEVKALATGNPYIKEKMGLEADVANLKLFKANYLSQHYALEDAVLKEYPMQIRQAESRIAGFKADIVRVAEHPLPTEEKAFVGMKVLGIDYTDKSEGGRAILDACKSMDSPEPIQLGNYRGFELELSFDTIERQYKMTIRGALSYSINLGADAHGNLTRMDNVLECFPDRLSTAEQSLENSRQQMINAKAELERSFSQEDELKMKSARLAELDALLNLEEKDVEIVDEEPDEAIAPSGVRQYTR